MQGARGQVGAVLHAMRAGGGGAWSTTAIIRASWCVGLSVRRSTSVGAAGAA